MYCWWCQQSLSCFREKWDFPVNFSGQLRIPLQCSNKLIFILYLPRFTWNALMISCLVSLLFCACTFACRRSKKSKRKFSQKVLIESKETTDSTEPQSGEGVKPKSTREWQVYFVFARWWCVQAAFMISVIRFNLTYGNVHFQRLLRG